MFKAVVGGIGSGSITIAERSKKSLLKVRKNSRKYLPIELTQYAGIELQDFGEAVSLTYDTFMMIIDLRDSGEVGGGHQ